MNNRRRRFWLVLVIVNACLSAQATGLVFWLSFAVLLGSSTLFVLVRDKAAGQ